jgi:hypothetical protein
VLVVTLNTELGWSSGDDVRVLVAAGLPVSLYAVQTIQREMNYIGEAVPSMILPVIDLLDQFDAIQVKLNELNVSSEGRVLKKVDVLEWATGSAAGNAYSPEKEIMRIRGLLSQYFASSVLFGGLGYNGVTALIRS